MKPSKDLFAQPYPYSFFTSSNQTSEDIMWYMMLILSCRWVTVTYKLMKMFIFRIGCL